MLVAAGVPQSTETIDGPTISDSILAPLSPAEAAASAAALAATTPADTAAAARANAALRVAGYAEDATVTAPDRPAKLTTLVATMDDADDAVARDRELRCLATAVYFESRGEPLEGQLAVAQAIMNRVDSGRYASSICGVVNQPRQFSFDRTRTPAAGTDWRVAQAIAQIAANDMWVEVAPKALSFHATYVAPNWAGKTRVATIGRHVFYR
jgi:spore germination cell wall hydrolase CwlJ-like protein